MKHKLLFIVLSAATACCQLARADDRVINDQSGNEFMEEVAPKVKAPPPGMKLVPRIIDSHAGTSKEVLQEVVPDNDPLTRPYHQADDYSNVGVSTDKSGNIVPLVNRGGPPVIQLGGHMQAYSEYPSVPMTTVQGPMMYGVPAYPYGYPYMPGGSNALNFRLGGVNIGIGPRYPVYSGPIGIPGAVGVNGPIGIPYSPAAPLGGGTIFGAPGGSLFNGINGLPSSGSYNSTSTFGPNIMQSSGSWRSF
ncbi:MAG TPA: hypothetical protein V6C81_19225 [Planktothrix sp.]